MDKNKKIGEVIGISIAEYLGSPKKIKCRKKKIQDKYRRGHRRTQVLLEKIEIEMDVK